jgi:hypothetical protein
VAVVLAYGIALSISHFERAALALFYTQVRNLESLTRGLLDTLARITGFAPPGTAPGGAGRVCPCAPALCTRSGQIRSRRAGDGDDLAGLSGLAVC